MIKELLILISITLLIALVQVINFFISPATMNMDNMLNIMIFEYGPFNVFYIIFAIYILIFIIRWVFIKPIIWMFASQNNDDVEFVHTLYAQSNAKIKGYTIVLFLIISLFFSSAIFWAYWAKIDELARGEGKVIPSAKIQTIQSLDGGIISELLVKEGYIVKKGQPLMKIDTTRFKASLDENKNALEDLIAAKVRLEAEINLDINKPLPKLKFNNKKLDNYPEIINIQKNMFRTRYEELKSTISILKSQVRQKRQELVELRSKKNQLYRSIQLIKEEMATIEKLVQRRAKANIELISIKREYNGILGDYNATRLAIPRSLLAIKESQNKITEKINMFHSAAAQEYQKVNNEMKKYESKVVSESDKLNKTVIVSPVDGIIKQIYFNTIGGVVRSGVDLIEIVPQSEILLVEAKISPRDIAFINPSQKAIVKITAYDFSIYGGLEGKIVEISADSLKDEDSKDGKTYYKVVIQTQKNYLEKDGKKLSIIPGMVASVDIVTGQKTILDFILKPILKTKDSALHER